MTREEYLRRRSAGGAAATEGLIVKLDRRDESCLEGRDGKGSRRVLSFPPLKYTRGVDVE